jgi:DNA-binding IclR family transcriptional regulator
VGGLAQCGSISSNEVPRSFAVTEIEQPPGKRTRAPATAISKGSNGNDAFQVRALYKGLLMLGLFDAEHREWTLDEMVKQVGLPRMTAYRMARTLQSAGYLVMDPATGRYHLGPAFLAAMYLSEGFAKLVDLARPYLVSLVEQTGESATLAVEVDGVAVCVDTVDTTRPLHREIAVGRVIGDTANAHGKLFAAFKPDEERERIINQPHAQRTPNTIVDPQRLRQELDAVRAEGVAYDLEERNLGTCAVGAPVRDQMGAVVATLAVIVPTGRFGPVEREVCASAVKNVAASLSAFLGYAAATRAATEASTIQR